MTCDTLRYVAMRCNGRKEDLHADFDRGIVLRMKRMDRAFDHRPPTTHVHCICGVRCTEMSFHNMQQTCPSFLSLPQRVVKASTVPKVKRFIVILVSAAFRPIRCTSTSTSTSTPELATTNLMVLCLVRSGKLDQSWDLGILGSWDLNFCGTANR